MKLSSETRLFLMTSKISTKKKEMHSSIQEQLMLTSILFFSRKLKILSISIAKKKSRIVPDLKAMQLVMSSKRGISKVKNNGLKLFQNSRLI